MNDNIDPMADRCFACGRKFGNSPRYMADTRDDQIVWIGRECLAKVSGAGEAGYLPKRGGPRLYPVSGETK